MRGQSQRPAVEEAATGAAAAGATRPNISNREEKAAAAAATTMTMTTTTTTTQQKQQQRQQTQGEAGYDEWDGGISACTRLITGESGRPDRVGALVSVRRRGGGAYSFVACLK